MRGLGTLVKQLPPKYEDLGVQFSEATLSGRYGGTHLSYQPSEVWSAEPLRLQHPVRDSTSENKEERSGGRTLWLTSGLCVHVDKHTCTPIQ